jgi:hypothetical protein
MSFLHYHQQRKEKECFWRLFSFKNQNMSMLEIKENGLLEICKQKWLYCVYHLRQHEWVFQSWTYQKPEFLFSVIVKWVSFISFASKKKERVSKMVCVENSQNLERVERKKSLQMMPTLTKMCLLMSGA